MTVSIKCQQTILSSTPTACFANLCVLAFTSGKENAQTDDPPFIEITLDDSKTHSVKFPKSPAMTKNKGGIWKFPLFFKDGSFEDCVERADIKSVAVKPGGDDGWNIKSILTMECTDSGVFQLLTVDMNVNRWIDGDGASDRKEFLLTIN